jgi:hypothetical protein
VCVCVCVYIYIYIYIYIYSTYTYTLYLPRRANIKFQIKNRLSSSPSSSREKSGTVLNNSEEQWLVYIPHTLTFKSFPYSVCVCCYYYYYCYQFVIITRSHVSLF